MELGTIETERKVGGLLPTLVVYIPRKGVVEWLFLGTSKEARAFVNRKVAEGYTRAWLWQHGADPATVDEFQARVAAQVA